MSFDTFNDEIKALVLTIMHDIHNDLNTSQGFSPAHNPFRRVPQNYLIFLMRLISSGWLD